MTERKVDVAIIGGGMGGMVLAAALDRAGIDYHLYEQAPRLGVVGGHLTIDTAAIEVLARYGLAEAFHALASPLERIEVRKLDTGEVVTAFPFPDLGSMGVADPNRVGARVVHAFLRADFVQMIAARLPSDRMSIGHRLVSLDEENGRAVGRFENGESVSAKALIGADGVRSMARRMFDDAPATPAGINICRTTVPASLMPADMPCDRMRFWDGWAFGSKERHEAIHVLIAPVRGGEFVCIDMNVYGGDQFEDCDPFDIPAERIMARLPATVDPVIPSLVAGRVEPFAGHPLFDRRVASKWTSDHIAILGDAAHSMRPTLGQGACQAIHDAGALANAFAEHGVTATALAAYEAERADYVKSIVEVAMKTVVDPKEWKDKTQPAG
jgi:salicylate hydroxylase